MGYSSASLLRTQRIRTGPACSRLCALLLPKRLVGDQKVSIFSYFKVHQTSLPGRVCARRDDGLENEKKPRVYYGIGSIGRVPKLGSGEGHPGIALLSAPRHAMALFNASRRPLMGIVGQRRTVALAFRGPRQLSSVADRDNILPVSFRTGMGSLSIFQSDRNHPGAELCAREATLAQPQFADH